MHGLPPSRYLTYSGPISSPATGSLRAALCSLVNEGAEQITILFSSDGGSTSDGIALYSYLRALPVELTMHAVGVVTSIAIPVFLAGETRLASENASFLFHEYSWSYGHSAGITQSTMEESSILLGSAVNWSKNVIKARTKLTDKDFKSMKLFDHAHLMTAGAAAACGMVEAVAEAKIAPNSQPRVVIA